MATITEKRLQCQSCDAFVEEGAGPLYECPEDGTVFNRDSSYNFNHQCPDCHRFSTRIADESCPECLEGELAEVIGYVCDECDEVFELEEDAEAHVTEEHGELGEEA